MALIVAYLFACLHTWPVLKLIVCHRLIKFSLRINKYRKRIALAVTRPRAKIGIGNWYSLNLINSCYAFLY